MKIIFIIIDGLGDKPIPQLGNKTPLEAANTPQMDYLAKKGICGLMRPFLYETKIPTSENSHLALFGYDSKKYKIKRGIFTAIGAGIKMKKGDIALRGNFATVDEKLNIIDRRAGRIEKTEKLIEAIKGIEIKGVKFLVKNAGGHRLAIVMRGKNLSNEISDGDTFYSKLQEKKAQKIRALKNTLSAKFTAKILNQFLEKTHQILKNHPENRKREKKGLLPANYILVRGASAFSKIPSFKKKYNLSACCIAGKTLYKGIGKILGMDLIKVKGANGLPSTNLKGKFLAAKKALRKLAPNQTSFGEGYDFVYLHIKAVDTFGEDGDWQGKKNFIEKIDKHLKILLDLKNVLIIITADHSTCCSLKRHCLELIPCLIYNEKIIPDNVKKFSEKECQKGKLGVFRQLDFMKKIFEV